MILIIEKNTIGKKKVYELEDLTTGQKKTWQPPPTLQSSEYRKTLRNVAENFKADLDAQRSQVDNNITPNWESKIDLSTPFGVYATEVFMPRKTPIIAENTRDNWTRFLRLRILPVLGNIPIGEITSGRITDFFLRMQAEGLSQPTVERYYMLIKLIFKMAYMTEVIKTNPMERVEKPKYRKDECQRTTIGACTAEEIAGILHHLQHEPLKWQVVVNLLIETGMRVGECLALQWTDIDWKIKAITIHAALGYTKEKGIYITTPKNKRQRTVYISDNMVDLLLRHYRNNTISGPNSPYVNHQDNSQLPMHPSSPLAKLALDDSECVFHFASHRRFVMMVLLYRIRGSAN